MRSNEIKEYYSCLLLELEIDHEDLITIIEVARVALEQDSFSFNRIDIGHELDLSDEELERIYKLIEIKEAKKRKPDKEDDYLVEVLLGNGV